MTPLKAIQCVPIYISKSTKHHPQSYILKAFKEALINVNNKKMPTLVDLQLLRAKYHHLSREDTKRLSPAIKKFKK